jgi:hypothetical protein
VGAICRETGIPLPEVSTGNALIGEAVTRLENLEPREFARVIALLFSELGKSSTPKTK